MSVPESTLSSIKANRFKVINERTIPIIASSIIGLAALVYIGEMNTWLTLTIAGLAMGMMIFVMASGLTLVFGLMDVLNFGHGAFISLGAFVGVSVLLLMPGWVGADAAFFNIAAILIAVICAMGVTGLAGYAFERIIIAPVYGDHLKQILITMGGLIVTEQLIYVFWGPNEITILRPLALQGSFIIGDVAIEKFRLLTVVLGLIIFAAMRWTLSGTRLGLIIRAGVENREMVEALGYRISMIFILVFVAGSALAGFGGVMWGLYEEVITAHMGMNVMILIFIVVIIGGLGSVEGCFMGALMVGLLANYTGYLVPKVALGSNILLMVIILMWRPEGLLPVHRNR
jgi:branched-chain amino acid transport system permease protein